MRRVNILVALTGLVFGLICFTSMGYAGDTTVLTFQGWIGEFKHTKPAWDLMVETFEKEHPDVKIETVGVPYEQSREQMIIRSAGGNAPDLTQFVAQWVAQVAVMGAVEPLDKYFTKEILDDIPKGVLESSKYEGKLYSFPWNPGAIVLVRNRNLMEKAGFDPDKPPETWDQLTEMIERITALGTTEEGEKIYGVVLRTSKTTNSAFWMFPAIWAFGGKFADEKGGIVFDSPGVMDAFKWYQKMALGEHTPLGLHITEVRHVFALNRGGFILEGPWAEGVVRVASGGKMKVYRDFDASLMPKGKDGISHAIANNHVFLVSKQCKNKDLAVEFIKHATANKDVVAFHYEKSKQTTTPFLSLLTSPPFSESRYVQPFVDQLETSNAAPFKHALWDASLEFVAVAMQKAMLGEDVQAAVKEAADSIRTLLGQ